MKKVLVANRGEIALRIFRSCRALGLSTVAVYSDPDKEAAHAVDADQAQAIGGAAARDSYLCADKIIAAARATGADAIHPGYGFLSENAGFAEMVRSAGLIWVGPSPDTILAMGDKQRARELAEAAGVPVVPGSRRFESGHYDGMEEAAQMVGYPLLVKAVAGGGGIGMRRVDSADKIEAAAAATAEAALASFGNGSVFLERFVPKARHVEIQVFGFGDGRGIHLFERDCSLQRRFQKVIEESPAPGLPDKVRRDMAECALRFCEAVRYSGAGTVEFIVDATTFEFYFLEMNTRIQVEHPVTEMVTRRDLVAMQLELARGSLAPLSQADINSTGHAIECRIYAENPARMFLPSPGMLEVYRPPATDANTRIDSGYREGDTLTPYYDPMLAKLIVWGHTRDEARQRASAALAGFDIRGIHTNKDFLVACLNEPRFAEGDLFTAFIDDHRHLRTAAPVPSPVES